MGNWDERILSAADKLSKGIEKGADYLASLNTPKQDIPFQMPNADDGHQQTVKHCPSCGHAISSIDMFCPACGSTIEDVKASSAAQMLSHNLTAIDSQKEGLLRNLIRTHQGNVSDKATQKAQMIKSFPVPNTKKDLLEFIHMAASGINSKLLLGITDDTSLDLDARKSEKLLSEAWLEKMESIYQKSKVLLSGDGDFAKIESVYQAKMREINNLKEDLRKKAKRSKVIGTIITVILLLGISTGIFFGVRSEQQKKDNLEALVAEIRQDIEEGNYSEALLKTNKVRLKDGSSEDEAKWDQTRDA